MIYVGIIGTAGRGYDGELLEKEHWKKMTFDIWCRLREIRGEYGPIHLVSGGAAWADHLAVWALQHGLAKELTLYGPCQWDMNTKSYEDNGGSDWWDNPGGTANYYHKRFSQVCELASLLDIHTQIVEGAAQYIAGNGFHQRNGLIAERVSMLIAYTTGDGDSPKDGGTLDTWMKCPNKVTKVHVPIFGLK